MTSPLPVDPDQSAADVGATDPASATAPSVPALTDRDRIAGPVLERLLTFLERTSDLVGVTDDKGTIVYLNRAARQRLGLREDTDQPVTTSDLFPQEAFDIYFDQIRPRILGGDVWTGYLPIRGAVEP